jgi:hypothetical protein
MSYLRIQPALPADRIPPTASPVYACAYCWRACHAQDGIPFPALLSSTICPFHLAWIKAQRKQRNLRFRQA